MKVNHPKISVIIPTYNCVKYLTQTLTSVFEQNYENLEIIVVNDGSTDNTKSFLSKYSNKIKVVNKNNEGVSAARNTGIEQSEGEFIAFLDCDDYWLKDKLKIQLDYLLQSHETGVVYSDFIRWNEQADGTFADPSSFDVDANNVRIDHAFSGDIYDLMLLDSQIHIISTLSRREIIEKNGYFRTDLPLGEDYDFWMRASRIARIDKIDLPLALYRIHNESITKKPYEISYGLKVVTDAVEKWGYNKELGVEYEKKLSKRFAQLSYNHGYINYCANNYKIAKKSFKQSLKYDVNIKTLMYILMTSIRF